MTIDNTMTHCIPRKINKSYKLKMDQLTKDRLKTSRLHSGIEHNCNNYLAINYCNMQFGADRSSTFWDNLWDMPSFVKWICPSEKALRCRNLRGYN